MARQLFDTEQLGPQWRLARAWARTRMSGHPVLKAQWQSLHVVLTSGRDSCNQAARRNSSCWASAGSPGGIGAGWTLFSSGAGADQAQRNHVAALAMISSVMMRLSPGR